jgi:hypothetical protein
MVNRHRGEIEAVLDGKSYRLCLTLGAMVLFQERDWWCAQCLEHDIAAQAPSLPDLQYEIDRVLFSHLAIAEKLGREPFAGLGPAPKKFWDAFENATMTVEAEDGFDSWSTTKSAIRSIHPRVKISRLPSASSYEARCQ